MTNIPVTHNQVKELKKGDSIISEHSTRSERRATKLKRLIGNNRKTTSGRIKQVVKGKIIRHINIWPATPSWMKYSNRRVYQ